MDEYLAAQLEVSQRQLRLTPIRLGGQPSEPRGKFDDKGLVSNRLGGLGWSANEGGNSKKRSQRPKDHLTRERMDEYPAAHGSFAKTPCISAEPRYSGAIRPSVELQRGGLGTRTWQLRLTPMRLSGQPSEPNVVWINWPRLACFSCILTRSKATGGRAQ